MTKKGGYFDPTGKAPGDVVGRDKTGQPYGHPLRVRRTFPTFDVINIRIFVLALFLCTFYVTAAASDGITKFGVVLLQPDVVLKERVPDVNALAEYIRAIEVAAQSEVVASTQHPKSSGFIVVAVRPGPRANVWLDFDPALPSLLENAVMAKVKTIQPFQARNGVVIFSLKVGLWGGAESARVAPFPSAWKAAAQKAGRSLETGALVESIWSE